MLDLFAIIILVSGFFLCMGLVKQKDLYTKLIFLNSATSIMALFFCIIGTYKANSSYLDIALTYFLLSVVANAAYLKFFLTEKNTSNYDQK